MGVQLNTCVCPQTGNKIHVHCYKQYNMNVDEEMAKLL